MLQCILGASGTGKSVHIHNMIDTLASESQKSILIVPEQFTYETEKRLFKQLGYSRFSHVTVTSFTRMAHDVFKTYGGIAGSYASDASKAVLMDLAITEMLDELDIYKKSASGKAFASTMLDAVSELKNAGISADALRSAANLLQDDYLSKKSSELALLYDAYQALLYSTYLDPLDDLPRAAKILETKGKDYFGGCTVFLDEFKGFTATEMQIIVTMLTHSTSLYAGLCCDTSDIESKATVFSSVHNTYNQLLQSAHRCSVTVKAPILLTKQYRFKNDMLAHMERNLFRPIIKRYKPDTPVPAISATLCSNEYDEVDFAVSRIVDLIQKEGYRYQDIAVISRDLEVYITKLQVAFKKNGIPFFTDSRNPIANKPLIRFIENALICASGGLRSEELLSLLKCGLLPYDTEHICELENYVYVWNIKGSEWLSPFTSSPRGYREEITDEDAEILSRINAIRADVSNTISTLSKNIKSKTVMEICKGLMQFVTQLELNKSIENIIASLYKNDTEEDTRLAEEYAAVWEIFVELLSIIITAAGSYKLTPDGFLRIFKLAAEGYDIASVPQALDCVVIGSAERIRTIDKKAVLVLGVNENVMPYTPSSGGMFTDRERELFRELSIELSPPIKDRLLEEHFIVYKTLCSPSDRLYLTARKSDISGHALSPSIVFSQLARMFGDSVVSDTSSLNGELYCKSKAAAFSYLAKGYFDNSELVASIKQILSKDDIYADKIAALDKAAKKHPFKISNKDNAQVLFGKQMSISSTRVDSFYQCRFKYFCEHGLRIHPLKRAELNPLEAGNLIHSIIYTVTQHDIFINNYSAAEIKKLIRSELDSYIVQVMGGAEAKTKRFLYLYRQMCESIFKVINRLHDELVQSRFTPCDFEYEINDSSEVKPLTLQTAEGSKIVVSGKIDRVDCYVNSKGEKYVRIVDYKSGKKEFKLSDVLYGLNLQMLIYLFCIEYNGTGKYENAKPAGILYMPAGEPIASLGKDAGEKDSQALINKHYAMNGLLLMDNEVLSAMEADYQGVFIPVETKKDSSFSKSAMESLVTIGQLAKIRKYINKLIIAMATELHHGNIEAKPIEGCCNYCNYGSVCAVDSSNSNSVKCTKLSKDDAVQLISKAVSDYEEEFPNNNKPS